MRTSKDGDSWKLTPGSIGTGLFLGLGRAIATGGPLGALLGYIVVGALVCAVQFAVGETAALLPVTGSFVRHAELLTDPALGFALGWTLVYGNWLSVPGEISAICVMFQYWTDVTPAVWCVVFIVLTAVVALAPVRAFGEIEFVCAILKILLFVGLIIFGLVTSLGGVPGVERTGFRYWKHPGPFVEQVASGAWGRFLGFWSVLVSSVFSFSGMESVAMAAAETRNPRVAIPRAVKRVFARVTIFYILSVVIVGMLVASDDPRLEGYADTATQSPFVIAASKANIAAIPHIVNAVVITSAWSSGNQALLSGSRVLFALALKRQAPRVFLRTNRWGVPYAAVCTNILFSFLAFMTLSDAAINVFYWFVNLVGCGVLISWSVILLNHVRLRAAMRRAGISRHAMPWSHAWTPYASVAGLVFAVVLLLTNGWVVFTRGGWDTATFITAYLDIGLVVVIALAWKVLKRTKYVPLRRIPLQAIFADVKRTPLNDEPEPPTTGWLRLVSWLWD